MPGGAGPARAGILGEAARTGFGVRPPCGQPPARPPLRAVPCIAQRLLALEADVGGQLVRGDRPRAGGVPRAATGQPHPRGGDRMGIPHGTLHRLFVDRHRSLRQHSPGHPLCGAGSRQARKIPAGGTRSLRKTLPRGTCRHLSLRRRSARRRSDRPVHRPAPRVGGGRQTFRTPPPRLGGIPDAVLRQDGLPGRPPHPGGGGRLLRQMHGAGARARRPRGDIQHQRPLLPGQGRLRAEHGLHGFAADPLRRDRQKGGSRLHLHSAVAPV